MSPTWHGGNRLRLLENGEEFFPRAWQLLEAAQHNVLIETFILADDAVGRRLIEILCRLARRGVRVAVLADGFGSDGLPEAAIAALNEAGARLVVFEPRRRLLGVRTNLFRRLHRKIVVVDDRVALLGGINFCSDHLRSSGERSLQDFALEVEGPVVADIGAFVRAAWASGLPPPRRWRWRWPRWRTPPPASPGEAALVAFVTRDNDRHRDDIERAYRVAIRSARHEVLIANAYFFPGYRFLRDLRAAARRGVRVLLVVQGKPDLRIVTVGLRWLYHFMVPAGIRIREFGERPLHAKIAVVDGRWATVGSSNLDPLSLSLNLEANLLVDDAAFAATLREALLALTQRPGRWVRREDVPEVAWWQRPMAALIFHFLRHFPAWAGWLPAHRSRIDELASPGTGTTETGDAADRPPEPDRAADGAKGDGTDETDHDQANAVNSTGNTDHAADDAVDSTDEPSRAEDDAVDDSTEAPEDATRKRSPWRWLGAALAVGVLVLLGRHLWTIDWPAVWRVLAATPLSLVLGACAVALAGHAVYGGLDVVSAQAVRHGLPRWRSWLSGVVCYGLGLNVGALVGAVASKLAVYRRQGLSTEAATRVVGLGIVGNWAGWSLLLAWVLSDAERLRALPRSELLPGWLPALSWVLVSAAGLYLFACARGAVIRLRGHRLALPPARWAALQMLIGMANWVVMAGVLHLCLDGATTFPESLAVLLVAAMAGAVAHVPGGWGVLEFAVVTMLGGRTPTATLLAAVLLFRVAYYLVPLGFAGVGYVRLLPRATGRRRDGEGVSDAGYG